MPQNKARCAFSTARIRTRGYFRAFSIEQWQFMNHIILHCFSARFPGYLEHPDADSRASGRKTERARSPNQETMVFYFPAMQ
jgi:hypothetical protein